MDSSLIQTNSFTSLSSCTMTNVITETSDSITDDLMVSMSAPNLCQSKEEEEDEKEEEEEELKETWKDTLDVEQNDLSYLKRGRAVSSPVEMMESVFPPLPQQDASTMPCVQEGTMSGAEGNAPVPVFVSPHSKDRRHRRSQSASVAELHSIQGSSGGVKEHNMSYDPPNGLLPELLDHSFGSQEMCPSPNNTPRTGSPVETDDDKMEVRGAGGNGRTSPPSGRSMMRRSYDSGEQVTNIDDYHCNSQDESHDCSEEDETDEVPAYRTRMPHSPPPEHETPRPPDRDQTPVLRNAPLPTMDDQEDMEEDEEEEEERRGPLDGSSFSSFEAGDLGKSGCHGDDIVRLSDVDVDMEMTGTFVQPDVSNGTESTHTSNQLNISRDAQEVSPLIERRNLRASLSRSSHPVLRSSGPNTMGAPLPQSQPLSKEEVAPVISALRNLMGGPEFLALPTPSKQNLERHGSTLSDSYIYNNYRKPVEHNLSERDMSSLDYGTPPPNALSTGHTSLSPLTVDQRSPLGSTSSAAIAQKKYSTPTPVFPESGHQPLRLTLSDKKGSPTPPHDEDSGREAASSSSHKVSLPPHHTTTTTFHMPPTSSSPQLAPSSLSPSPPATSPPLPPPPPLPPVPKDGIEEESNVHGGLRLSNQCVTRDDSHAFVHESLLDREVALGRPTRPQSAARSSNKRGSKMLEPSPPLEFFTSDAYLQRSESLQIASNAGRTSAMRRDSDASRSKAFKPYNTGELKPFQPVSLLDAIREPALDSPTPPLVPPTAQDSEGEALEDEQLNVVADLRTDDIPELALPEMAWYKTITKQTMRKMKKEERERQEIIHELAITQKHHVRILNLLDLVFRPQLSKYLSADVIGELFPGLDDLLVASKAFDARLDRKRSISSTVEDISDVLLEQLTGEGRVELLRAYSKFCSLHMNALEMYKEQTRKKNIKYLFKELHSLKDCQRLTLPDFYQSISQHLTKLVPVMNRLAKKTESLKLSHTARLKECADKFLDLVASVDKAVSNHEKHVELLSIHNRLEVVLPKSLKNYNHLKGLSLIAHNRTLRKRGDAIWMGNGKQMSMMCGVVCVVCVCGVYLHCVCVCEHCVCV